MQKQTKNTTLFIVLMVLCVVIYFGVKTWFAPPPPVPKEMDQAVADLGAGAAGLWQGLSQEAVLTLQGAAAAPEAKSPDKPAPPPVAADDNYKPTPIDALKTVLGENDRNSKFHLHAVLDAHGAVVRRVVLNKFQQADPLGRPMTLPDGSRRPMELIPDDPDNPSFLLLAYDVKDKDADKPYDTLGRVDWTVDGPKTETLPDGRVQQSVKFTSPPLKELHGLRVTKTFSLTEGEYHLGMEVNVTSDDETPVWFRYQLTGAHGLPIEGRWYTGTFHNSLIGQVEENKPDYASRGVSRDFQDLRQVATWEGGNAVERQQGYLIRYAGVAVQYFASVIVVDAKEADGKTDQKDQSYLTRAQPTLETELVKGTVQSVAADGKSFVLVRTVDSQPQTFFIRDQDFAAEEKLLKDEGEDKFKADGRIPYVALRPNQPLAVVAVSGSFARASDKYAPSFARQLRNDASTQPLWEDDVTVRVNTAGADVKKGQAIKHNYLLYNGPVKVMLLDQAETAAERVAPGLVSRYIDQLNLNTLTDFSSASWIGSITGPTGISWMLIQITNIMHTVLWFLHAYLFIPYILCIVCLTLMVRGVMFPVSRKQALTSLKMQQLAPEMKKLTEKHKDDKQALAAAQMEMYRKHGVNPFGTCWLLLLQMPIFMGLYYSLQESIHFRLAGVSSWWMPNLSAPDMLLWWSNAIPLISEPSWYGWLWYLGPYLNILPVVAVSLMLVQQKWTMPPPTDDQQAQQQKMMKYMMVFMGLMFYKVASGLCIYFIASSIWGFAERQFLPKKKTGAAEDDKPQGGVLSRLLAPKPGNGTGVTTGASGKGKRGKRRQESKPAGQGDGDGSMFQRLRDWWADLLEQARKK